MDLVFSLAQRTPWFRRLSQFPYVVGWERHLGEGAPAHLGGEAAKPRDLLGLC